MVRFHATAADARTCLDAAHAFVSAAADAPTDSRRWRIRMADPRCVADLTYCAHARGVGRTHVACTVWCAMVCRGCGICSYFGRIGCVEGGPQLIGACGFVPATLRDEPWLLLQGGFDASNTPVPALSDTVLAKLRGAMHQLAQELAALDGVPSSKPTLQKLGAATSWHDAVVAAKMMLKYVVAPCRPSRRLCTSLALTGMGLLSCVRVCARYVSNVLTNPKDRRCWTIPAANPVFRQRIGCHPGAAELMLSIGFAQHNQRGGVAYVLRGTEESYVAL